MNVIKFSLQERTNPTNGDVKTCVAAHFDNGEVIKVLNRDQTVEKFWAYIQKNRADVVKSVRVMRGGEFGPIAVISQAKILEEC